MDDYKLLKLGFNRYDDPHKFTQEYIECVFQKLYKDDVGKKYFLDIYKWKPMIHPYTGEKIGGIYEYKTQLYSKDIHEPIDLTFHSSWLLEDVEYYLEKLFDSGMFDYYEVFDE